MWKRRKMGRGNEEKEEKEEEEGGKRGEPGRRIESGSVRNRERSETGE